MSTTDAQRDRYATIVRRYLAGDYTMDPDDAGDVANDVIAAYVADQAARQAAMERVALDLQTVLDAATPNDEWPTSYTVDADDVEVLSESLAIMRAALDATEQEDAG